MPQRYCYLLVVALISLPALAPAADDSAEFLDAMRKRGMNDLALDYLDFAQNDRLVSDEFKKQITYERGATLLAKWEVTPTVDEQKRLAAQARQELSKFVKENPGSIQATEALQKMAGLLTVTSIRTLTVLEAKPTPPDDASQIKSEVRGKLEEARNLLEQVEKQLVEQLGKFPKALDPKTQSAEIDQRRQMREQLARVRVLKSENLLERVRTLEKDSDEYKKLLKKAVDEFQSLYDKYDNFPDGFVARLSQGECYLKLGDTKKANSCFDDIIIRCGDIDGYRLLVTRALALQAQIMIAEGQLDALLDKQGKWLATARGVEHRQSEWLELKYQVAEAKRKKMAEEGIKDGDKRKLMTEAREHYTDLAQLPGEYQMKARQILAEDFPAEEEPERRKVKDFDEALQAAKDAFSLMNVAKQTIPAAEKNNPEGVEVLKQQAEKGAEDALYYLKVAKQLVDDDTKLADLNECRWLSCYLMYQNEEYYQTAVLAGFIARRYPEDPKANMAAKLSLASYQRLFQEALKSGDPDSGAAEAARLKDMASFITRRWSGTSLANEAFELLLAFSLRDQEFDAALGLLKELPEDQRSTYQAKIANSMWEMQLRAAIEKDDSVDRVGLKAKAVKLLDEAFPGLAKDPTAKDTLAASALYLTQARIEEEKYQEAIKLLEDQDSGPIALSKTNNPIASRDVYMMEAYKAALRAYVSVIPPQTDKAVEAMAALEKAAGGGGERLTRVYLGLGVQLQQQIKDLQEAGNVDAAKRVSEAFVAFLEKLTERGSSDPTVRKWIAQTYYQLAAGLQDDPTATDTSIKYYGLAADAYKLLLTDDATAPKGNALLGLRIQYANALRYSGRYAEAMQIFELILREKEMLIDVQKSAAYTLQEWGANGDTTKFKESLMGGTSLNDKGKPIIWGWNYLSKIAISISRTKPALKQQYKELFYECWLNIARISYLRSEAEQGATKTSLLKEARSRISTMVRDYSDLLQTPLKDEYDELLKSIQRAEGAPTIGLNEIVKQN